MGKVIGYTPQMLEWLEANQAGISRKELTALFNNQFDMAVNYQSIKNLCARKKWISGISGNCVKGSEPWNKGVTGYMGANATSFKKGQKTHNHKPIGSERVCKKDGYVLLKVAEPQKWQGKHISVWEKENGSMPPNHCIRFLDNDRTNCDINNLICIPRGAHAVINKRNKADTSSIELNRAIMITESLAHKARELTNATA